MMQAGGQLEGFRGPDVVARRRRTIATIRQLQLTSFNGESWELFGDLIQG